VSPRYANYRRLAQHTSQRPPIVCETLSTIGCIRRTRLVYSGGTADLGIAVPLAGALTAPMVAGSGTPVGKFDMRLLLGIGSGLSLSRLAGAGVSGLERADEVDEPPPYTTGG
jgi:hypothetical protein